MVSINRLLRESQEAQLQAQFARGETQGLKQAVNIQNQEISFLETDVLGGQQTQQELTQSIQSNVLRSLRNFQTQQRNLDEESRRSSSNNKLILPAALILGAIAFIK